MEMNTLTPDGRSWGFKMSHYCWGWWGNLRQSHDWLALGDTLNLRSPDFTFGTFSIFFCVCGWLWFIPASWDGAGVSVLLVYELRGALRNQSGWVMSGSLSVFLFSLQCNPGELRTLRKGLSLYHSESQLSSLPQHQDTLHNVCTSRQMVLLLEESAFGGTSTY